MKRKGNRQVINEDTMGTLMTELINDVLRSQGNEGLAA